MEWIVEEVKMKRYNTLRGAETFKNIHLCTPKLRTFPNLISKQTAIPLCCKQQNTKFTKEKEDIRK